MILTFVTELLLALTLFVATNIDDVFVLIGFFADRRFAARDIVVGQYLGVGLLVLVSVVAGSISLVIPQRIVGLLGLAPVAVGILKLTEVTAVQPRIRLTRSFDQRSHSYLGYLLRIEESG